MIYRRETVTMNSKQIKALKDNLIEMEKAFENLKMLALLSGSVEAHIGEEPINIQAALSPIVGAMKFHIDEMVMTVVDLASDEIALGYTE